MEQSYNLQTTLLEKAKQSLADAQAAAGAAKQSAIESATASSKGSGGVKSLNTMAQALSLGAGTYKQTGVSWSFTSSKSGKVTQFADGGIVNSPQVGMVGEAGPEAIIPLNRAKGFGGVNVNIGNVYGVDARSISQAIQKELRSVISY